MFQVEVLSVNELDINVDSIYVNRVSLALHDKIHKIIPTQFFWVHLAFWVSKLENQKEKKSKHFFFLSFSTLRKSKAKSKREFLSLSFFPSLQARQVKARVTLLFLSLFLLFSWEKNIIDTLQEKLSPSQKLEKMQEIIFSIFLSIPSQNKSNFTLSLFSGSGKTEHWDPKWKTLIPHIW